MSEKVEVKSNGIVVGYSYDEGKTINFLDNEEALIVMDKLNNMEATFISARKQGTVDDNGKVTIGGLNELCIVNLSE